MLKLDLIKDLYDIGAIKFGEFTLKSGKKSPYYIDLRILPSYPQVLINVGKVMGGMIQSLQEKPTRLCGVPMAGLAIANMVGAETGIPVCYTRKEPIVYRDLAFQLQDSIKEGKYKQNEVPGVEAVIRKVEELSGLKTHGIARYIDGEIKEGDKIGIVDDLITTADSKLEARDLIMLEAKRENIKVGIIGVYVLLDRQQGGKESLQKNGVPLYSVATITEIMEWLYKSGTISSEKYKIVTDYVISEKMRIIV